MKPARIFVILVREFSTGMQPCQDQLNTRNLFLGMLVDRHPTPVVTDLKRTVLVQLHVDTLAMACHCLVDAVIDDLMREVIRPGRIGIHARTAPDRLQATHYLEVRGAIALAHLMKHLSENDRVGASKRPPRATTNPAE